jgi:hypothetical protein
LDFKKRKERWDQSEVPGRSGGKLIRYIYPRAAPTCPPLLSLGPCKGSGETLKQVLVGGLVLGCQFIENKQKIQIHSNMGPAPLWVCVYRYLLF